MKPALWRYLAVSLAVLCAYQRWQSCTRAAPPTHPTASATASVAECAAATRPAADATGHSITSRPPPSLDEPAKAARGFFGFKAPAWAMALAPRPGETMRAYRDRVLPLAELAIAPQRERVSRLRDTLALDARQRAQLDAAVDDTRAAIERRITAALTTGELRTTDFKPMTGVALARDVLDLVDGGNKRFLDSLSPDQRTDLASGHFDFADYLLFSARWAARE